MSPDDIAAAGGSASLLPGAENNGPQRDAVEDVDDLSETRFVDLLRARQTSPLPLPLAGAFSLPLGELDPEVLERLAAELIKRRPNLGAHFYGRRGQGQHGLDIVERGAVDANSVYQVRRYQVLTPGKITSAVTEYADPKPPKKGGNKPPRRFKARRYVLLTSAEFETETALQDRLEELQARYVGDLVIEVWGREKVTAELRDCGALVNSVFGPEWARAICGFAPPPPGPADPDRFGLVEDPILVLNLGALESDARMRENDDPLAAGRLHGVVAEALEEANFPAHADGQRRQQAKLLRVGHDSMGAFGVLWGLALDHFKAGAAGMGGVGEVYHDLEELRSDLDDLRVAKLDVLTAAQNWYEHGSQLELAVPGLEVIRAAADHDAAFLACVILEQALADGWFDFDPPYSLVTPGENMRDFLSRLRQVADDVPCADVVIRARLACALADAGRYLRAGGLVFSRAAHAFAMRGDTARAIDLWRQSILLSSEFRLYGDVFGCRRALDNAIFEQPVIDFSELRPIGPLPNTDRLLAAARPPELDALRAAHAGQLPDAFGVTRRYLWESRLSGQLSDERDALELFGDVLLAAGRLEVAVIAWVMAGAGSKAADHARNLTAPVDVERWARSPARAQQAAAAQVIGAQARLYDTAYTEKAVHILLDLTAGLWTTLRIAPNPPLDAVNALSRFGNNLPASAVEPVLGLLQPVVTSGGMLTLETASLLIQLYWAVPTRRDDLATLIGQQLALGNPPPGLWEMVANLPRQARGPVTSAVSALADADNPQALFTLARWGEATTAVQFAARRTCAQLLRQLPGEPATTWSLTSQFRVAATLILALTSADTPTHVDPADLRPGAGPVLTGGTLLTMMTASPPPAPTETLPPSSEQAEIPPTKPASKFPGAGDHADPQAEDAVTDGGAALQPDPSALIAAGPPPALAAAVADHLLAVAESSSAPAFVRAEALAALHSILGQLPAEMNSRLSGRLLSIAENPALNEHDQAELASQDPLSRGRLDMGAKGLPTLALVCAASAASSAVKAGSDIESLPAGPMRNLVTKAVDLLHSPDPETTRYGAIALALASRCQPGLAHYGAALVVHPSDEVRSVAASMAALDKTVQPILAADPSPKVRIALASRARELDENIRVSLAADEHADVKRALASAAESGGSAD